MVSTIPARVRDAVLRFDRVTAHQSVRQFCYEQQISTTTFYRLRQTAELEGAAAAMRPRSRAPHVPARRYGEFTIRAITTTRAQLIDEGWDCGPWSIWWRLAQQGVTPLPSRSTIARILRREGLSVLSPAKRPRSSWRRFQRAKANELWQLDAVAHRLADQTLVTIYQVIDDCTRMCVGLHARQGGESFVGAQETLTAAFGTYGPPAAVLTDNHRALNQHRYHGVAPLEEWLAGMGIRPISGQIAHPQTQGKTERSHQTLDRWLTRWVSTHPDHSVDDVNAALPSFTQHYNQERQHQGLGQRITPLMAWHSVDKASPADHPLNLADLYGQPRQLPQPPDHNTVTTKTVTTNSTVYWRGYNIRLTNSFARTQVHLVHTTTDLEIYDTNGTLHAIVPWPPPTTWFSAVRPPYRVDPNTPPEVSPKS